MARRRQAFGGALDSYADPAPAQNPANRAPPNAAPQQQRQHKHHQHPVRAPGPVHAKVQHDVDVKTLKVPGEPVAQVIAPAEEMEGLDVEDDEDEAEEGTDEESLVAPPLPTVSDEETCFICAEKITYFAVGVCGHTTCHICAIRLRVFYKKMDCTFCKTLLPSLLFTTSADTPFPSTPTDANLPPGTLDLKAYEFSDAKLGIVFESAEMMEATLLLLRFNCPSPNCAFQAAGWDGLEKHTLSTHGSVLCHLCRRQLSRFAHEQVLYPPHLLGLHDPSRLSRGQRPKPRNKAEEQMVASWGAPHPMCEFCHEAFFGADELFKHMRNRHEECFVCKEQGQRDVYFKDYPKLEAHFNHSHHPCTEQICLEKKFVVFGSEVDLKAHMVNEHGAKMNSKDRHRARQLDVGFIHFGPEDSFIPPEPTQAQRRANPPARSTLGEASDFSRPPRGGRHAAPQSQQLPQPPNDREARRKFERKLTNDNATGQEGSRNKQKATAEGPEAAVAAQHARVMELVMSMVDYSEPKMAAFRNSVRAFKSNEAGARDMIYTIYSVLNSDQESTVKIARDIAALFRSDPEKETSVLEAINEFKIDRRNEFPTLGDGPTGVGTEFAGVASGKILSAKRVTQPGANNNQIWDRVERAAASAPVNRPMSTGPGGRKVPGASGSFPALGGGKKAGKPVAGASATPWAGRTTPAARSGFPSLQTSAVPVAPVPRSVNFSTTSTNGQKKAPKPPSAASFPGLPASAGGSGGLTSADRQALFGQNKSDTSAMISRMRGSNDTSPVGWAGASSGNGTTTPTTSGETVEGGQGGGKKKGKKQTLLFTVSASGR